MKRGIIRNAAGRIIGSTRKGFRRLCRTWRLMAHWDGNAYDVIRTRDVHAAALHLLMGYRWISAKRAYAIGVRDLAEMAESPDADEFAALGMAVNIDASTADLLGNVLLGVAAYEIGAEIARRIAPAGHVPDRRMSEDTRAKLSALFDRARRPPAADS